jgi:hypothetical protein
VTGEAVAAAIAHEVKQPLTAAITDTGADLRWLTRASPDLYDTKAAHDEIITNAHRAAEVIHRVRAMLRTGDLNRTAVDPNSFVAKTLDLMRAELQKHRIPVKTELTDQLPRVIADQIELQQVLLNLIANAIDSMATLHERRLLCVTSDDHDGGVTISVPTPEQGSVRVTLAGYSTRSSRQNLKVWEWGWRFVARFSRRITAACWWPQTSRMPPSFSLSCAPTMRPLLILREVRKPTISRLIRASDADIKSTIVSTSFDRRIIDKARFYYRRKLHISTGGQTTQSAGSGAGVRHEHVVGHPSSKTRRDTRRLVGSPMDSVGAIWNAC